MRKKKELKKSSVNNVFLECTNKKGIKIDVEYINEANHMFSHHDQELMDAIKKYLNNVLDPTEYNEL